jgi:ankyrin repeat protein
MSEKTVSYRIYHAIRSGQTEEAIRLIKSEPQELHAIGPFGTWLHFAAHEGNLELVEYLTRKGCDINIKAGLFGGTPINEAATYGHLDVVRYLLQAGAVLDTTEPEQNPLFGAIYGGNLEVVKLLLAHGIDAKVRYTGPNMNGMDAIAFARERGQMEIAAYLAAHG